MRYRYENHRAEIFTEHGQVEFLKVRDRARELLNLAGAFMVSEAIRGLSGDVWSMLSYVDRLVELGEIREITDPTKVFGQHRDTYPLIFKLRITSSF